MPSITGRAYVLRKVVSLFHGRLNKSLGRFMMSVKGTRLSLFLVCETIFLIDAGTMILGIMAKGHTQNFKKMIQTLDCTDRNIGLAFNTRYPFVNNN
jgi:hypothetical protein